MALATNITPVKGGTRSKTSKIQTIHNSVSSRDYVLNPDKWLQKKLQATKRQEIEYEIKGGGIVAKLDAVSFELFHYSCKDFFHNSDDEISRVDRDSAKDGRGNIVQYTYTVHLNDDTKYTVNMYSTKCSLLVNGRATTHFIDYHLPKIHKLMSQVKIQGMKINTKELNEPLASQLQKVVADSALTNFKTPKPARKKIELTSSMDLNSIVCLKCNKNCRKRAVQCDSCNRWLHYNCERLDPVEINNIETNKDFSYKCKTCVNTKNNTYALKMPTLLQSPTENTVPKTLSQSILSEEMCTDCFICCNPLNDDEMACEKCDAVCHFYCMSPDKSDICPTCAATELSNNQDISQYNESSDVSRNQNTQNSSPQTTVKHTTQEYKLPQDELTKREAEVSLKQNELRLFEQKLKKREDDIKLKEVKIKDYEKNSVKIESKINSLEFRNKELESTVKTLKERINMLEPTTANKTQS